MSPQPPLTPVERFGCLVGLILSLTIAVAVVGVVGLVLLDVALQLVVAAAVQLDKVLP